VGKPLVRFCEGLRRNWCMAEILWHRRETRRQTENTNVMPIALEGLFLLDKIEMSLCASPWTACRRFPGELEGVDRAFSNQHVSRRIFMLQWSRSHAHPFCF
jgi:hypothetical protein